MLKCAIYDSTFNLLTNGITEAKTITTGQDGWVTFNFPVSPSIEASAAYYLAWWGNKKYTVYEDAGISNQTTRLSKVYNSWPDSLSPVWLPPLDHEYSIFATYLSTDPAIEAPASFGKFNKGIGDGSWSNDNIVLCKYQSGTAGLLKSIALFLKYFEGEESKAKCAIYDSSMHLLTNGITGEKGIPVSQYNWMVFNFLNPPEVSASTVYYLAFWFCGPAWESHDTGAADQTAYSGSPVYEYNGWPSLFVPEYYTNRAISIFAQGYKSILPPSPRSPSDLRCEQKINPTDVIDPNPEFSAIYHGS